MRRARRTPQRSGAPSATGRRRPCASSRPSARRGRPNAARLRRRPLPRHPDRASSRDPRRRPVRRRWSGCWVSLPRNERRVRPRQTRHPRPFPSAAGPLKRARPRAGASASRRPTAGCIARRRAARRVCRWRTCLSRSRPSPFPRPCPWLRRRRLARRWNGRRRTRRRVRARRCTGPARRIQAVRTTGPRVRAQAGARDRPRRRRAARAGWPRW